MNIDFRERDLIECLTQKNVAFKTMSLPLGDIQIGHILIERKKNKDYAASIKDGRWREQKGRMLAQHDYKCMYIIEGTLHGHSVPLTTLISAMCNTMLRDGIHVIRTVSVNETVIVLQQLMKKMTKMTASSSGLVPPTLSKRKRNSDAVFLRMLMCVPGCSEKVASKIIEQYTTMAALRDVLQKDPASLQNIQITPKRKIGPSMTGKLVKHILG